MRSFKETIIKTFTLLFFAIFIFGCKNEIEKEPKSLKGKVYNEISEIPELENFEFQAGSMIDYKGKSSPEYRFGLSKYFDKKKYLVILEEKLGNGNKISSKILDTIVINHIQKGENIIFGECRVNGIENSEIIAVIKEGNTDEEYFKNVVKAWKADTKAGKIFPIKNLREIDCFNEGYGL